MSPKPKIKKLNQLTAKQKQYFYRGLILFVVLAAAGTYFIYQSQAATFGTVLEAESGARSGNTSVQPIQSVPAGSAVKFGTATTPTPTPTPPAPTPTPTTPPVYNPADRIATRDFESGNLSGFTNQSCPSGAVVVQSPVRKGNNSVRMTVTDSDTSSKCSAVPTNNPRAQLIVNGVEFGEGDEFYVGMSVYLPANFPTIGAPVYGVQVMEIYGPPFGGSPPIGIEIRGDTIGLARGAKYSYDQTGMKWSTNISGAKGKTWIDLVFRIKLSTNPSVGFVEVWHNGVKQKFAGGSERLNYDTLENGVNWESGGYNEVFINHYRSAGLGTLTVYHDELYIGKTYESVAR